MISKFPNTKRVWNVINANDFSSTRDNLINNWFDFDFDMTFFENYKKLFLSIDIVALVNYWWNENSDFADVILNSRNCYLSATVINNCENVLYSFSVKDNCKNVINSLSVYENCENIYMSTWIIQSYNIFFSKFINNSSDIYFSSNLNWCHNCIFCDNLENCSYFINNKKYNKEQYKIKKDEVLKEKDNYLKYYLKLEKIWKNINSTNTKWSSFFNSENIEDWYFWYNVKNWKNCILVWWIDWNENMYDVFTWWAPVAKDFYWIMWANWENLYNSMNITASNSIYYSQLLTDCSFCLWCIWLKNKSYCILNKQYSKEEWEMLADKIFSQMDKDWILWDFFPWILNPFYFNDTMAWILGNFTKQEVEKDWYLWREDEIKVDIPENVEIIKTDDLLSYQAYDSNWNWKINPEILKKVIIDKKWNYYKITKFEYDFLVKNLLPIPEMHWSDRIKINFWV